MITAFPPSVSVDNDPKLRQAINEIFSTYGERVSVERKKKSLLKFGALDATAGTNEQTIAEFQGSILRETYVTTNAIDSMITDDNNFSGNVVIEGHTISGGDLTFVSQTVACNGQTAVSLSTPLARATRAFISDTGGLTATSDKIYIYDSSAGGTPSGGVPANAVATKLIVNGLENQSEKGSTSLSSVDFWIVSSIFAGTAKKSGASSVIRVRTRQLTDVFRTTFPKIYLDTDGASEGEVFYDPYKIIPYNSDLELTVTGSASSIEVAAGINGYLATVV